jgi:hypothetical protein
VLQYVIGVYLVGVAVRERQRSGDVADNVRLDARPVVGQIDVDEAWQGPSPAT